MASMTGEGGNPELASEGAGSPQELAGLMCKGTD